MAKSRDVMTIFENIQTFEYSNLKKSKKKFRCVLLKGNCKPNLKPLRHREMGYIDVPLAAFWPPAHEIKVPGCQDDFWEFLNFLKIRISKIQKLAGWYCYKEAVDQIWSGCAIGKWVRSMYLELHFNHQRIKQISSGMSGRFLRIFKLFINANFKTQKIGRLVLL